MRAVVALLFLGAAMAARATLVEETTPRRVTQPQRASVAITTSTMKGRPIIMFDSKSTTTQQRRPQMTKATASDPIPAWVTANTRPLLAVGKIININWTSGTLLLGLDPG